MEFNLTRLKQLAGMSDVMEDDESAVDGDETSLPDGKSPVAKPGEKAEKAPQTAKPATDATAKQPAPFAKSKAPDDKTNRGDELKSAGEQRLDPNWIRASIKHLVDRAHAQVQTGDKNVEEIKAELQHHHDMMYANLKGLHRFPFANPAASNEDKQNATELFDLSSNLDKLLRAGLGAKKASELDWLR